MAPTSTVESRPLREHLRITELMYDPVGGSAFEFIELHNTGTNTLVLSNVFFSAGITYAFSNQTLAAGAYTVLVQDLAAFTSRYGTNGIDIAGSYTGQLANEGESIELLGPYNAPILAFETRDARGWPLAADGPGHSLVPLAAATPNQDQGVLNFPLNWRASGFIHGSPGAADPELPPTLVLNEFAAHTDFSDTNFPAYDSDDWIELFNNATSSLTFTDYYLSDDKEILKKWRIPTNHTVAGRSWISFNEVSDFHRPITHGFGLDKAGEQLLLSYLPGNANDRVVDAVRFKAQENGRSLGRFPDGTPYWMAMPWTRRTGWMDRPRSSSAK